MKYVLVTGAGGGMGAATVALLQGLGYSVFALDRVCVPQTDRVFPISADITDAKSLQQAYDYVCSITDNLYAIIHFAGIYMLDSLIELDENRYAQAFDINVFGAYRINKLFVPLLHRGSRIVITTSELAPLAPLPFTGVYAITKSALDQYAASLRMELQLLGISVAVLRPGAVKTDMLGVSTDQLDEFCKKTSVYTCNARKFRRVVDRVEARNIAPQTVAAKIHKILDCKRVRPVYHMNRNPLLLLLNALPMTLQLWIIKQILK